MASWGTGIISRSYDGRRVNIDGRKATISAVIPERVESSVDEQKEVIYTNPAKLWEENTLPSFSLVRFAKVKNFIDGVYAAVELRVAEEGHPYSRPSFLKTLESLVDGYTQAYVSAARQPQGEGISQGFYDWSPDLRRAYQQIKIVGTKPGSFIGDSRLNGRIINSIRGAIGRSPELKESYSNLIGLYSKTTGEPVEEACLFPSARLPDQELFMTLSDETQSDIPGGLGKALVQAIKDGRIDFTPGKKSGLYIRQMHEIVPLVLRDTKEFEKFKVNKQYIKVLEDEFISQWVGTRETHVGHYNHGQRLYGCSIDYSPSPIVICPELSVEPFSTAYERMKSSLMFLEDTIRENLPEVLDSGRVLNDGARAKVSIGEEFKEMETLLDGLSLMSNDSIHLQYEHPGAEAAIKNASNWLKGMKSDPDINRNVACFVPIIQTTDGSRQICYINAGYKIVKVDVSYDAKPEVTSTKGNPIFHEFGKNDYELPILVHREVRMPSDELINSTELRKILPSKFTKSKLDEIVKQLEGE